MPSRHTRDGCLPRGAELATPRGGPPDSGAVPRETSPDQSPTARSAALRYAVLILSIAAVIAFYAWAIAPGPPSIAKFDTGIEYYNLLVKGFRSGHLSLQAEAPAGLLKLKDPYDPRQNAPFGMHDVSFYKGKLYLYFGAAPALVLYWPFTAITGLYLDDRQAVFVFCVGAFLAGCFLLGRVRCMEGSWQVKYTSQAIKQTVWRGCPPNRATVSGTRRQSSGNRSKTICLLLAISPPKARRRGLSLTVWSSLRCPERHRKSRQYSPKRCARRSATPEASPAAWFSFRSMKHAW